MNDSSTPDRGRHRSSDDAPGRAGDTAPDDAPGRAGDTASDDAPEMVTPDTAPQSNQDPGRRERDPLRTTIRGIGQVLITAGVVVLLFVVYELWITNILGAQKQAEATAALDNLWAQESAQSSAQDDPVLSADDPVVTAPGGTVVSTAAGPTLAPGERTRSYDTTEGAGFAKLYIPSFGADFVFTVVEGTNQQDLYAGPGHYQKTQYPGQPGNFALAGHRVNKGAPFDDLGLLHSCDAIVIETVHNWYVYRVLPMHDEVGSWSSSDHAHCDGVSVQKGQYAGVYGREITDPKDIQQVYPVPHSHTRAVPKDAEALITLTTCHPKFSDRERMIIHGILVKSYPKSDGFVPPELQETS